MAKVVALGTGAIGIILALLFVALSFGTDHWIEYVVDRGTELHSAVDNDTYYGNPLYFSRDRGLFRTCYLGTETLFLEQPAYADQVVDGRCLVERGYELSPNPETINYGEFYDLRVHLMRCHFGFQIVSMVFFVISIWCVMCGCWSSNYSNVRSGAFLAFLGALSCAAAMAFFHGYDFLEREKIAQNIFRKIWMNIPPLQGKASFQLGYSYMTGWVGAGLGLMSTVVLMCASDSMAAELDDLDEPVKKRRHNKAYDYMVDDGMSSMMVPSYPMTYDYPTIGGPMVQYPMPVANMPAMYPAIENPAIMMGPPLPEVDPSTVYQYQAQPGDYVM